MAATEDHRGEHLKSRPPGIGEIPGGRASSLRTRAGGGTMCRTGPRRCGAHNRRAGCSNRICPLLATRHPLFAHSYLQPSARRRLRAVNGLHGLASLATVACGTFSDSPPVRGYYSPEGTEDKGEPKM